MLLYVLYIYKYISIHTHNVSILIIDLDIVVWFILTPTLPVRQPDSANLGRRMRLGYLKRLPEDDDAHVCTIHQGESGTFHPVCRQNHLGPALSMTSTPYQLF